MSPTLLLSNHERCNTEERPATFEIPVTKCCFFLLCKE
jgi:hypothetical protein